MQCIWYTDSTKINRPRHTIRMYWTNSRTADCSCTTKYFWKNSYRNLKFAVKNSFSTFPGRFILVEYTWVLRLLFISYLNAIGNRKDGVCFRSHSQKSSTQLFDLSTMLNSKSKGICFDSVSLMQFCLNALLLWLETLSIVCPWYRYFFQYFAFLHGFASTFLLNLWFILSAKEIPLHTVVLTLNTVTKKFITDINQEKKGRRLCCFLDLLPLSQDFMYPEYLLFLMITRWKSRI